MNAMQELKDMRIWLCWNYTKIKGQRTKKPVAANGGPTGTDCGHSSTWVTFAEASVAKEAHGWSGVGFVVPAGYFFLDLDHRALDDPFLKTLLIRFNSYAERSVSGEGVHIYGKCDLDKLPLILNEKGAQKLDSAYYMKNPLNDTELYLGGVTNRFAVYTEDMILDRPLAECTDAVLMTLDQDMRRERMPQPTVQESPEELLQQPDFDLDSIVQKLTLQKNGEKFRRLYYDGDISGYGSPSEADAALCSLLAFRVGPDHPEVIDQLFRKSALMREKWERKDYREATIRVGIEACHGNFFSSAVQLPYYFYSDKYGNLKVNCALLAKYIRENLNYILVRDNGMQGTLIYVYKDGYYQFYAPDMLKGEIKRYIADYDESAVRINVLNETFQLLMTDLNYVRQEDLNADETLINVNNGLLRVTADEITLLPHAPNVYSTVRIPVTWTGQKIMTPVHQKYLSELTGGDIDVISLLYEFMGVVMSNIKGWRMKKALFMVGPGDTGKSQAKALVERMLGSGNFIGIDLKGIEARFGTGAIYGKRLAGSSDMSFMTVDELKTFKKITGGDSLFAEFKGQQAFEYTYSGLLWFCMNELPKFGGDDGKWVYDRIMVVPCNHIIPKEEQDKELLDKMYAERDGIFYYAMMGLQRVLGKGYRFTEPECVLQARQAYIEENSTVISFFQECMTLRSQPDASSIDYTTTYIYSVYKSWCKNNNNGHAKTEKQFRVGLAAYLNSTTKDLIVHKNTGNYYRDYTLTAGAKKQYAPWDVC